ncbi:hypothetical protein [Nocardia pseudobrasiliensis]|uniref:Uncharacterized protein n=1 Tax=Nocardia pseudobrasiliensis TaxID=45979 RepID=A0A370IE47_9NOCA|nr:hypothetical protein [Nocardia pseudobrasiliensis]RDI67704.1 hypothetical protein DFR76_102101 [Nocardia pseudobrasiliensis]
MLVFIDKSAPEGSREVPQKDFSAAAKALAGRVDPPTGGAGVLHKLLAVVVEEAIRDSEQMFTDADVIAAYRKLHRLAQARVAKWQADAETCRKFLGDKENQSRALQLTRAQRAQDKELGKLEQAQFVVITRGTDPTQALNIMTYETFGGLWPGPARDDKPSEEAASTQTGFGVKTTEEGRIEEWSLGALTGFATGGFLLIAAARPDTVRLPPEKVRGGGERGVCGFADQRLLGVALLSEGRVATDIQPLDRAIESILKRGADNAASALRDAVLRRSIV